MKQSDLEFALRSQEGWQRLVEERSRQLRQFLRWGAACEAGGQATSLRLEHREDIARCCSILHLFFEPWWAVSVYSCFDSVTGTQVVAPFFSKPIEPAVANDILERLEVPMGSVGGHRTQAGLKGAKESLISACQNADAIRNILSGRGDFENRFRRLSALDISWWGRTTYFDVLLRAGILRLDGQGYRPNIAHLLGSTGPSAGFKRLWGVEVTADVGERILKRWSEQWNGTADSVGVDWTGPAYDSGDFENALCIFQKKSMTSGRPDPARFVDNHESGDGPDGMPPTVPSRPPSVSPRAQESTEVMIDADGYLPRRIRVAGKTELVKLLRRWLAESAAPTIGDAAAYGGTACLLIHVGDYTVELNVDTKRSAVETFVRKHRSDPERPWRVVRNARGIINKVIPGPGPQPLAGWYGYLTRPWDAEGAI